MIFSTAPSWRASHGDAPDMDDDFIGWPRCPRCLVLFDLGERMRCPECRVVAVA